MGQGGEACRTDREIESCRRAGGQTKKERRPDRPKRVGKGDSAGGLRMPAWAMKNNERYYELRHDRHREQVQQGALSEPAPNWRGTALQDPSNAKKVKIPQKPDRQREKRGGLEREIKKNKEYTTGGGFIAYHACTSLSPLFSAPPTIGQQYFFHLAQNRFWVLWPVLRYWYCVHSTPPG
jgi:hypothetical protein